MIFFPKLQDVNIRELLKTTNYFLLTTEDTENAEEFLIVIEMLFNGNF
jgi:hypothetical protein